MVGTQGWSQRAVSLLRRRAFGPSRSLSRCHPKLTINMAMWAVAAKLSHNPAHAQISTIQQAHAALAPGAIWAQMSTIGVAGIDRLAALASARSGSARPGLGAAEAGEQHVARVRE
jgi:hypothetical protein